MEADAYVNLVGLVVRGIVSMELGLNSLGALHGMDDGGKLEQEAVAGSLNHVTRILSHGLLDDVIVGSQQPQRASFIGTHLAAKAHHIGEHDGGEFARLGRCWLWRLPAHEGDYAARSAQLSNDV
jgi:hypothetical protein